MGGPSGAIATAWGQAPLRKEAGPWNPPSWRCCGRPSGEPPSAELTAMGLPSWRTEMEGRPGGGDGQAFQVTCHGPGTALGTNRVGTGDFVRKELIFISKKVSKWSLWERAEF